jgi:hypothetical protein
MLSIKAESSHDKVLLFVRKEGEPYMCLGSVIVSKCNLESDPIVIEWELLQLSQLSEIFTFKDIVGIR